MSVDPQWIAEVDRRISINEGRRLCRYRDSLGVWTIGVGYNIERSDAPALLQSCGADYRAVMCDQPITDAQADRLFALCFSGIIEAARSSLADGVFDALSDARRFVLCDLEFNLGQRGWLGFPGTRALLNEAQANKNAGKLQIAHALFNLAGDHLAASAWDGQVGDRANRDIAMIRNGVWVDARGDGRA